MGDLEQQSEVSHITCCSHPLSHYHTALTHYRAPHTLTSQEVALVRDALQQALEDLKRQSGGAFGASKLESRLMVALPALTASLVAIIR